MTKKGRKKRDVFEILLFLQGNGGIDRVIFKNPIKTS